MAPRDEVPHWRDATSGLLHSLVGTAANVANVNQVDKLLRGAETYVSGDSGYTGAAITISGTVHQRGR